MNIVINNREVILLTSMERAERVFMVELFPMRILRFVMVSHIILYNIVAVI